MRVDKTSVVEIIETPTRRVPRFGVPAGIGGILVYLFSSIPLILVITTVKYTQLSERDLTSRQISRQITDMLNSQGVLVGILVLQCVGFLIYAFVIAQIRGSGNFFSDFGLRFTKSSLWFLLVGIALQFIGIGISIPIQLLRNDSTEQQVVADFRGSSGVAFIFLMLLIGIVVPFIEELCFRGLFMRGLNKKCVPWVSVLLTGTIFAAVHFSDPSALYGGWILLMVGLGASALAMYRGRIDASICLHVGFNLSTVAIIVFTR